MNPFTSQSILYFASRSLCTTEAWVTTRWAMKFVYKVGSTIFYKNICWGFAIVLSVIKADLPANVTFFHYRIPHPFSCARVVGIFVPAALTTTTVNREMLREFYFYWFHSGFYDNNKDRLQSEMKIARGMRLLKSTFQDFFNVLKFWQPADQGWDLHLTRKIIMH